MTLIEIMTFCRGTPAESFSPVKNLGTDHLFVLSLSLPKDEMREPLSV